MKQINQELDEQRRAEKRAVEAQKNKKQKAEKEAKLEVLKGSKSVLSEHKYYSIAKDCYLGKHIGV
jgi:hypothetical protein